jgi:UDP-glucose 4-epimerase
MDLMNHPDAPGRVYNIGSTEEITIEALADKIIKMTASKSEKKFISYEEAYGKPFDDMMRRVPCLDRIKETVGYEPKTSLEQTLKSVIEDIKTRM